MATQREMLNVFENAKRAFYSTYVRRDPYLLMQAEGLMRQVRRAIDVGNFNELTTAASKLVQMAREAEKAAKSAPKTSQVEKAERESKRRSRRLTRSQAGPKKGFNAPSTQFGQGKKAQKGRGGRKAA